MEFFPYDYIFHYTASKRYMQVSKFMLYLGKTADKEIAASSFSKFVEDGFSA